MSITQISQRYSVIQDTLRHARIMHDVFKEPVINDTHYDSLVTEAIAIEKEFPQLIKLTQSARSIKDQILSHHNPAKHDYPMLRLNRKYDLSGLISWLKMLPTGATVEAGIRIEGVALELIYIEGKLHKAITEGDGIIGRDVTVNAYCIKDIPESITDAPGRTCIRGVVTTSKMLVSNNDGIKLMCGLELKSHLSQSLLKLHPTEQHNELTFIAHTVTNPTFTYPMWSDWNAFLRYRGFQVPPCCINGEKAAVYEPGHWEEILDTIKTEVHDLPFKGLVFTVREMEYRYELGYTSRFPEWAIAYVPDGGLTNVPTA